MINIKITKATFFKEFKRGLPSFSNITASMGIEVDVEEGKKLDTDECWDFITREIQNQTSLDPSWINTKEHNEHFTTTIKTPKQNDKQQTIG